MHPCFDVFISNKKASKPLDIQHKMDTFEAITSLT